MDNQQVTVLPLEYFIELHQSTKPVTSGGGQIRQLTTWHKTADLSTLTLEEISTEILDKTFQTCPVLLKRSALNLEVETESDQINKKISERMNGIAWMLIVDAIFSELYPNFSSNPQAPLKLIKQTAQDENGGTVTLAGSEYYRRFQLATSPLMTGSKLKLDLTSTFLDGLNPYIRNKIRLTDSNEGAV